MSDQAIPIPYTSRLVTPIKAGQTFVVQGDAIPHGQRFEVNFLDDCTEISPNMGSVPLHMSIRFDQDKIVLNSFLGAEWGKEERYANPFKAGEPFDIRIRVHEDKFEIMANQHTLASFNHRREYTAVDHFQVLGDITLNAVQRYGHYFDMPFEGPFHGHPLQEGQRVHVHGVPKGDFSINFLDENNDMVFHFNPRFSESAVVRNSQKDDEWGNEERELGEFPFAKGRVFDLVIHNEPYSLQIFMNGDRLCTFAHRVDPKSEYKSLKVDGDVDLLGIELSH